MFFFSSTFSPGYHDERSGRSIHDILPCETVHKRTHTNAYSKRKIEQNHEPNFVSLAASGIHLLH